MILGIGGIKLNVQRILAVMGDRSWNSLSIKFLTELTSNTARTKIMLLTLVMAVVAVQFHPLVFIVPAVLVVSFLFMLSVATTSHENIFSSGWMSILKTAKVV